MFNLFRRRDKAVRYLLGALLLMVALSMVVTLIPGYGSNTGGRDPVLAQIGKDSTLSVREAQLAVSGALRGRQVPPDMVPHVVHQLIDQMITERLLAYEAKRLGFQVSDADVANAIRTSVPQLFQNGQFVGRDAYAAVLAQQNVSIPEFESEIGRQVLITRLRNMILEGVVVSPAELQQEFRRRSEKIKIEYVKLTPEKFQSQIQVNPEEMRAFFNSNRAGYVTSEKRSLQILLLDQARMEQSITLSDAELQRAYEQNKDRFRTPERAKVRHILLKTVGKAKEEEPAIQARTEALLKQVKAGGDFAQLARKNSEDTGSAAKGGDLDWIVRGQTVPAFEKAAFSLKPKEISDVVKTEYGFHILQVLEKQQAHLRTFEEVKNDLSAEYKKQLVNQRVQDAADRAQAALRANSHHPERIATELNVPLIKVEKVGEGDPLPEIGVSKEFDAAVAGLKKGDVTQPVLAAGNKLIIGVVTDVFPPHPAEFNEVEGKIRETFVRQKLDKWVAQRAEELVAKGKELNGDLRKAAQGMGLEVKTSEEFTRQGAVEGLGSASYVVEAFGKPAGTLVGPLALPDSRVVVKVLGPGTMDRAEFESQKEALRQDLKMKKARERNTLFEDGLRRELVKEGKVKIHQDEVNRLVATYRRG